MKQSRWYIGLLALTFLACGQTVANDAERPSGLKVEPNKLLHPSADRMSFAKVTAPTSANMTNDVLRQFKDDAIFLNIAGVDILKWGIIREHIEDAVNNFPARPDMGREGYEAAKQIVFQTKLKKLLSRYLQLAVVAVEARRLGLTVDEKDLEAKREESRRYYTKKGKAGEKPISFIGAKRETFYEHNLTNALLWRAYADKVVRPNFTNSAEEIKDCVLGQHQANVQALATNVHKMALINDIHRKVKGGFFGLGKMDFAEAARKWSECPSYDNGGLLTDQDEKPQKIVTGDVREELETAYRKMKPGEISDVVETPFSWHIIKLLARHPATDTEAESVEMAHIMLEKAILLPEMTDEQANRKILDAKVKVEMQNRFIDLFKATKIDCLVDLVDKRGGEKRKGPRKRIIKAGREP